MTKTLKSFLFALIVGLGVFLFNPTEAKAITANDIANNSVSSVYFTPGDKNSNPSLYYNGNYVYRWTYQIDMSGNMQPQLEFDLSTTTITLEQWDTTHYILQGVNTSTISDIYVTGGANSSRTRLGDWLSANGYSRTYAADIGANLGTSFYSGKSGYIITGSSSTIMSVSLSYGIIKNTNDSQIIVYHDFYKFYDAHYIYELSLSVSSLNKTSVKGYIELDQNLNTTLNLSDLEYISPGVSISKLSNSHYIIYFDDVPTSFNIVTKFNSQMTNPNNSTSLNWFDIYDGRLLYLSTSKDYPDDNIYTNAYNTKLLLDKLDELKTAINGIDAGTTIDIDSIFGDINIGDIDFGDLDINVEIKDLINGVGSSDENIDIYLPDANLSEDVTSGLGVIGSALSHVYNVCVENGLGALFIGPLILGILGLFI